MQIDINRDVTTNIQGATQFGTTNNSAKLFSMLSNMLYKNKERSVITELSSNAIDAHKLVGKEDVPIVVTMPTSLCPEIRIRDFGPGLSHENVIKFLTTYGESDKQQSNDFIGGYGIGSKSPASVSDTWSVHSYHAGVHRQYLIFVSGEGVPSLTKIVEKETTETGLEVIVPVKVASIYSWNNACAETFMHYPLRPVFHNFQKAYEFKNLNAIYRGTNFVMYNTSKGCSVIINHRQYPLDTNKIIEDNTLSAECRGMLNLKNINLQFNIGELSLSLSREDLQYDKKTITAIQNKTKSVFNEFKILWETEVNSKAESELHYFTLATNFFEKYIDLDTYSSDTKSVLYEKFSVGCKFYSKTFKIGQRTIDVSFNNDINVKFLNRGSDRIIAAKNPRSNFGSYHRPSAYSQDRTFTLQLNIRDIDDVVFVLDDSSCINLRVKNSYENKKNVVIANDFSALPEFLKKNIVLSSTLERPVIVRTKKEKIDSVLYRIVGRQFVLTEEAWFNSHITAGDSVAYVRFTNAVTISSCTDEKMMGHLESLNIIVLGLKPDADVPAWAQEPTALLTKMYQDMILKNSAAIIKTNFINSVKNHQILNKFVSNPMRTKNASKWNEFIDLYHLVDGIPVLAGHTAQQHLTKTNQLQNILNIIPPAAKATKYDGVLSKVIQAYPLLDVLNMYADLTSATVYSNIVKYIESCGV